MITLADTDWTHAFMRILGDEIRRRRKERGWTRNDLCARLSEDISLQTLATYELGTRNIHVVRLVDIAKTLGTTAHDILQSAYERVFADPDTVIGWTIDLLAAARLDAPELTPLRGWAAGRTCGLARCPKAASRSHG